MSETRKVPAKIYELPLKDKWRWAREMSRLSHDRIVEVMGRSNRSHLIKIEKGDHTPRADLRDAYADATSVPRDLFVEQEAARQGAPFPAGRTVGTADAGRGGRGSAKARQVKAA